MSREKLEEILARAMEDGAFRSRLLAAPAEALAGYELTAEERQAFLAGSLRELLLTLDHDSGQSEEP
ncbi:MAG TPA: Os1348 family NHLP clan protein [bacterium]|nr:Os1348 family NHLP clan protein [bacterium]